jgi:PAS domain S-box-containing protein
MIEMSPRQRRPVTPTAWHAMRGPAAAITSRLRGLRAPFVAIRPSLTLFGLAAILALFVSGTIVGVLVQLRASALGEAEREIRNLNVVLAEQTARSMLHVDVILRMVTDRVQARRAVGSKDQSAIIERIRELIADTPQIRTIVVTDADGFVTQTSSGLKAFIGDRAHFKAHQTGKANGIFIGAPYVSRSDNRPAISISRRLDRPDGRFDGIVAAALDPTYFNDIYRDLDLGKAANIALFRGDGICLLGCPPAVPDIAAETTAAFLSGAPSGTYPDHDAETGAERLVSFHRVGNLPLVGVVSVTLDAVLEEWRRECRAFALGGGAMITALCLLIFSLGREVRRREALAEALRINEARFRHFAESSADWFWEQDANLRFTYLSDSVEATSGLSIADHLGKTRQEIVRHGVTAEQWLQHQADLDARRPFRDFRFQRISRDGTIRHISISGQPVFDNAGRFAGYAGNARNITPQVTAEQRLIEAKAEAEAASRAKGEFLAVISHELRTPLNAIIGFSDVIGREILGPIGVPRYREYAGDILAAGRHLLGLINNILDMSKIEARKMELSEEDVDVGVLIESCVKIIEPQASEAGIVFATKFPSDLPHLFGDAMRLKQILLNLMSNAVKFTSPGGRVTLSGARLADGTLEIAVADTGIGMSEEETQLALQPFRQVESALARKHEGTGLGLPLVKAFTEMHGGTLALSSTPGCGTVARIVMPVIRVIDRPRNEGAASNPLARSIPSMTAVG